MVSEATLRALEPSPKAVRDVFDAIGAENVEVIDAAKEVRELATRYIEAGALTAKSEGRGAHRRGNRGQRERPGELELPAHGELPADPAL